MVRKLLYKAPTLGEHLLTFLLNIYLEVEFLYHRVGVHFSLKTGSFQNWLSPLHSTSNTRVWDGDLLPFLLIPEYKPQELFKVMSFKST